MLESILFLSLYLLHTWRGELNQEEYYKTLKEVDRTCREPEQKFHMSGISAGMDAQVEVKFVGGGTRMYLGNTTKYREMNAKFGSLLMEMDHETWC